jgi:hypothetical protein
MFPRSLAVVAVLSMLLTANAGADFKPPADGTFTESQLVTYLDTQKDWLQQSAAILQNAAAAKTPQAKSAAVANIDQKYQACLAEHKITREEYEWMAQQAQIAWGATSYVDTKDKQALGRIDEKIKLMDQCIDCAKQQLAEYQNAKKKGLRVLTAQQHDDLVKQAQDDAHAASDEVKQHETDALAVDAEVKQHDADAKDAETAAANPPADLTGTDRDAFIQNKKDEAAAARDSATEARNQASDDRKDEAEAQARADAASRRAEHPEIPITDDEKSQALADDDIGILDATKDVAGFTEQKLALQKERQNVVDTAKQLTQGAPAENIALMKKYADRYKAQIESASRLGSTTQPAASEASL